MELFHFSQFILYHLKNEHGEQSEQTLCIPVKSFKFHPRTIRCYPSSQLNCHFFPRHTLEDLETDDPLHSHRDR